jgi:hypothetical protein
VSAGIARQVPMELARRFFFNSGGVFTLSATPTIVKDLPIFSRSAMCRQTGSRVNGISGIRMT